VPPGEIISSYSTSSSYDLENFDRNFGFLNMDMEKEKNTGNCTQFIRIALVVISESSIPKFKINNLRSLKFPGHQLCLARSTNANYLSRTPQASTPTQSSIGPGVDSNSSENQPQIPVATTTKQVTKLRTELGSNM
jgi:hypothetical protein